MSDIFNLYSSGDINKEIEKFENKVSLTEEQENAVEEIYKFLEDPKEQFFSLQGYAGTGKTTVVGHIASNVKKRGIRIFGKYVPYTIASAPTNKAVKVLAAKLSGVIPASTIHKLLAVRPFINNKTGEEEYKPDKYQNKDILDYNFVIVDEASMVNKNLFEIIQSELEHYRIKVLFVGDPAQLPPVNETRSMTFDVGDSVELTKVVRYGNVINKFATFVRKNQDKKIKIPNIKEYSEGQGIETLEGNAFKEKITESFLSDAYKKNGDTCRILAYTNDRTDYWNSFVRGLILGTEIPEFVVGDQLVAREACVDGDYIILKNSEEVRVMQTDFGVYKGFTFWQLNCKNVETTEQVNLRAIHESSKKDLQAELNKLASKKDWRSFYGLKKYFHDLTYSHALTVHKSQGSTFKSVYVDVGNIYWNKKIKERNQLLYVAVTRASNNVFMKKMK